MDDSTSQETNNGIETEVQINQLNWMLRWISWTRLSLRQEETTTKLKKENF